MDAWDCETVTFDAAEETDLQPGNMKVDRCQWHSALPLGLVCRET
jgi:hypothetical protein